MRKARKFSQSPASGVDSTIILGDLTDVTQISRNGTVVTVHGRENPRSFSLANEQVAIHVWRALAKEASSAVEEDRQFFCVSFGQHDDDAVDATRH